MQKHTLGDIVQSLKNLTIFQMDRSMKRVMRNEINLSGYTLCFHNTSIKNVPAKETHS